MRKWWLLLLIGGGVVQGDEQDTHGNLPLPTTPWFTGPLLAPSAYTAAPGHFNLEPYLYYVVNTGNYNSHWKAHSTPNFYSTYVQVQNKVGIVRGFDFQFFFAAFYNQTEGKHYCNIGDLPIGFNIQLLRSGLEDPWPAMKLSLRTNIPLGKYQHLDPDLKRTDAIGAGSWLPGAALIFSKMWNTSGSHFLESRLACIYQIGTAVHVKGFNSYGGSRETKGVVYPGNTLTIDGSVEYNLTRRWVFTCDLVYTHSNWNRFSGKTGDAAPITAPSNAQWTLAPAIEYNWSDNLGAIAGPWFSFAGRNVPRFASGVAAVDIYF